MKKLSKLVLVLFSIIILIIGVIINLLVIGWLDYSTAFNAIQKVLTTAPQNKIVLGITEFCMLFAIICIFADSGDKEEKKSGRDVLMQNAVVKEFPGAKEAHTKIGLDAQNNLAVFVDLTVTKDVIIKDLTLNMQNRIKEAIKKTSDLEVNEVNVRIKNIVGSESEE